jgi:hypothetical protein
MCEAHFKSDAFTSPSFLHSDLPKSAARLDKTFHFKMSHRTRLKGQSGTGSRS